MDPAHRGGRDRRLGRRAGGRLLTSAALAATALAGCAGLLGAGGGTAARRRLLAVRARDGAATSAADGAATGGATGAASDGAATEHAAGRSPPPRSPAVGSLVAALARGAGRAGPALVGRASAGLVVLLALAGRPGLAVALAAGSAVMVAPSRRRAAAAAHRDARVARDLPRVVDLVATCLEAGVAPADAVVLVSEVVGGPVRDALLPVASAIRVGVDPATAWAGLTADGSGDALRRVARAFARAASTGAPLADTLSTVADDERERLRWAAEAAAQRAGVRAVGPLAVCFLPAFLLLGVVPVVVAVAADVVGQLG